MQIPLFRTLLNIYSLKTESGQITLGTKSDGSLFFTFTKWELQDQTSFKSSQTLSFTPRTFVFPFICPTTRYVMLIPGHGTDLIQTLQLHIIKPYTSVPGLQKQNRVKAVQVYQQLFSPPPLLFSLLPPTQISLHWRTVVITPWGSLLRLKLAHRSCTNEHSTTQLSLCSGWAWFQLLISMLILR